MTLALAHVVGEGNTDNGGGGTGVGMGINPRSSYDEGACAMATRVSDGVAALVLTDSINKYLIDTWAYPGKASKILHRNGVGSLVRTGGHIPHNLV